MYRQFGTSADPEKEFFEDAFGKEAKMDGIARQDWLDYIGPAAPLTSPLTAGCSSRRARYP